MTNNVLLPPETVASADWLVGPFTHGEGVQAGELAEWQVPFYDIAVGGLRRISGMSDGQEFPVGFQPDPIEGVGLYRELSFDRKVHGMINGLLTYIGDYKAGTLTTKLRPHQQEIMDAIAGDVVKVGADRQINIKSPTGTGKTAVLTTLVEALKYKEQPTDKVRALVLLPTKDVLGQTVRAFKKFTDIESRLYILASSKLSEMSRQ